MFSVRADGTGLKEGWVPLTSLLTCRPARMPRVQDPARSSSEASTWQASAPRPQARLRRARKAQAWRAVRTALAPSRGRVARDGLT
jgi:hypothetical protein